ncbi:MAG: D-aminoacyl-tRNA deacylase [Verrucomicrobiales bacterium]
MRALIQRVSEASVAINTVITARIGRGFVILLGIEEVDTPGDAQWLAAKVARLRVFADEAGAMNLALSDVGGGILVVSQFTLHASTRKGNRPSFLRAASPERAIPLYQSFVQILESELGQRVQTGEFGADMKVALINDGPVTIWIDSRIRE